MAGASPRLGMQFAIGSTSPHKVGALRDALARPSHPLSGIATEILPFDVSSGGVDVQPFGIALGSLGSENRAAYGLMHAPGALYSLGVENFLEIARGTWLDIAHVTLLRRCRDATKYEVVGTATSVGIPFPEDAVINALRAGPGKFTAATFAAHKLGGDPTNPHATITGGKLTRKGLLADAIFAAFLQIPV